MGAIDIPRQHMELVEKQDFEQIRGKKCNILVCILQLILKFLTIPLSLVRSFIVPSRSLFAETHICCYGTSERYPTPERDLEKKKNQKKTA